MSPPARDGKPATARSAGLLAAVGLLYASACGGPYGTEDYVARTGPGLLMLLVTVAAGLWGVPLALATAELSARRPVEGGFYRWVREYLGEFWGFQAGVWSLLSSFLDNALYPVLFGQAVASLYPGVGWAGRWVAAVAFVAILTGLNILGIRIVGAAAVALNVFLLAPMVWMVGACLLRWRHDPFAPFATGGTSLAGLGSGLALAIWFHSGYSEISTAGEEIREPRRTIPLVLLIVTPLVVLSYTLPVIAGLAASGGWETWVSGQFATISLEVGGPLLARWAFLGGVASFTVIFMSYLLWWSRLAWAFAADGFMPRWLVERHPRFGTPHRVLLLYGAIYAVLAAASFDELLIVDVWLFGAYDLLMVLSLVRARRAEPGPSQGFRVPGGSMGPAINAAVLGATWIVALVATAIQDPGPACAGAAILLGGFLVFPAARGVRARASGGASPGT